MFGVERHMLIRILTMVICCGALAAAQTTVPTTPAGRVFTAWLSAFNAGDSAALQAFNATHQPDAPPLAQTLRFRSDTGGFTVLRVEKSTPTVLVALLEERDSRRLSRLQLEVTGDAQPLVVSSTLRGAPRPADLPRASLSESEALAALAAHVDTMAKLDRFSGAVLVGRRGQVLWQKAVGFADRDSRTPNTLETQFRNGSMNKMFTATAALQLIEAGKMSLDDTVGKFLPDYPNKEIAAQVTIRHLLTHTGGTGDFFGPLFEKNRLTLKTHSDYVALFGARGPLHPPGAEFRYSNYGMVLLGAIIERVSGVSYFDFVRTSVFERAGMRSTGALPETETVPNRSAGYMRRNEAWIPNTDTLPWSGTSAGGGYSTVGDFFRFAEALQSGRLISKESLAQMSTPGRGQYGFGMTIRGEGARRVFGHSGGAPGQNGELRVFPESGYTIVVLSNYDPPAASRLAEFIEARLPLAAASGETRQPIVVDDFETGSLSAWTIDKRGSGGWLAYQNGKQPPDPRQSDPFVPFHMPNPPQGQFAAASDGGGPGTRILYRDLKLDGPYLLDMTVFYVNGFSALSGYSNRFITPRTLALNAGPNQQFRIDVLAPTAAADTMADADIRGTVFETTPDSPAQRAPTSVTFDLSRWAGQTVRLRIATADNQGPLRGGVDNIRLIPLERN